jgi:tetratricopeptide (TPR) repeat protein
MAQDAARRIQAHDYQAAPRLLDRALAMDPDRHRALDARALLLARTGKEPEALELYRRIIATHATDSVAYFNLAGLHQRSGRLKEALSALEQLFTRTSPQGEASATARPLAYALCRDIQEARAA